MACVLSVPLLLETRCHISEWEEEVERRRWRGGGEEEGERRRGRGGGGEERYQIKTTEAFNE